MNLRELVSAAAPPEHWSGKYKIPWNELDFSRRLLDEHLDQTHDAASRRLPIVDSHVNWIHRHVLEEKASRVLDLCCGPGLYTNRLVRLGHECVGIDFSPASIAYAIAEAEDQGLGTRYVQGDIREVEYGGGYGLAMMLFGEFNTFPGERIQRVLERMYESLAPGGRLLLEPQRLDAVERSGHEHANWYRSEADLFADQPHICLEEHFWDEEARVATDRYFAINAGTAEVSEYHSTTQGYQQSELADLVDAAGFEDVEFHRSLTGSEDGEDMSLMVVGARKS